MKPLVSATANGVNLIDAAACHSHSVLHGLSADERKQLLQGATRRRFAAHWYLLRQGEASDSVYVLLSGTARVWVQCPRASSMTLAFLGGGEVLGEVSAIDDLAASAYVMTTESSDALCLSRQHFALCLEEMPALNRQVLRILAARLRRITEHAQTLATLDVPGRIAHQLLVLAANYGQSDESASDHSGAVLLPLRLPSHELGALTGASREQVSRVLGSFKALGWVSSRAYHRLVLHDVEALRRECH